MSTPEGKLALAWLRFINNKTDPNGFIPIMVFEGYSLSELKIAKGKHEGDVHIEGIIPPSLLEQREKLYRKKRRVTEMLTMLFAYYGGKLDQDIVQSIIAVLSSEHRSSLLTISDMIDLIQTDIENRTAYPVEVPIGKDAVRIMTIHKSKGMQFRTVIIPFMDGGLMPKDEKRHPSLRYDESYGIRCAHEIGHFGDYEKICHNWRSKLVMRVKDLDRNEYKRLLFVAMTRAEQYLTLISMDGNVSEYIKYMAADRWAEPVGESEPYVVTVSIPSSKPSVGEYVPRRENLGVHDIMRLDFSGSDEVGGKGMEYGTQIHQDAQMLFYGREPKDEMPEHPRIREILDSVKDADLRYSEIEMKLPVSKYNAILKGYIDLMAVYPDRVEIIDYKTDAERSDKVEKEYSSPSTPMLHPAITTQKKSDAGLSTSRWANRSDSDRFRYRRSRRE